MKLSRAITLCATVGLALFPAASVSATNTPAPSADPSLGASADLRPSAPDNRPAVDRPTGPGSLDELRLVGSANLRPNGYVRLVNRRVPSVGAAYTFEPVDVTSFDVATTFRIRRGCTDGISLLVQNDGPRALAGGGRAMGYGRNESPPGITHSLAMELDTYQNREPEVPHLSVQTRGRLQNDGRMPASLALVHTAPVNDRNWHDFSAHYADDTLQVSFDGEPLVEQTLNLSTLLELPDGTAYVGVVGANGGCLANITLSEFTLTTGT